MAKAKKTKVTEEPILESPLVSELENSTSEETILENEAIVEEKKEDIVLESKEQTLEEKILSLASNDYKKINDLLISIYTLKMSDDISVNKNIKEILSNMVNKGEIEVSANRHMDLAMTYYDDDAKAKKHNILNTDIFIKK
jgi:hypothetical protein